MCYWLYGVTLWSDSIDMIQSGVLVGKSSTFPRVPLTSCNSYYIYASPADPTLSSLHQIVTLKNKSVCLTWSSRLFCDAWYLLLNFSLPALGMTKSILWNYNSTLLYGTGVPTPKKLFSIERTLLKMVFVDEILQAEGDKTCWPPTVQLSHESANPQVLGSRDYLCYNFKNNPF